MNKLYHTLDHFCGNRWFVLIFIPIAACFLLLYSASTSPLYLTEGADSVIFKTMGLAILQGKIPYVDFFDHKGPVLYLINALGQWLIPGRTGILLLQFVSLVITLFFMYKIANLFINHLLSFIWVIVALCILGVFYDYGNLSEEWNLSYLSISLYYAIAYFSKESENPHPYKYALIYGLCFGMAFFIRPNDAIAQIGGVMLGVTFWLLYRKQYENMLKNIIFFVLGFMIIAIPIIVWFGVHGALDDLYYGLLHFNGKYSNGLLFLLRSSLSITKLKFFMFFLVLIVMVYNTVFKNMLFLLLPILSLVVVLMGTNPFMHYYIVVVPFFLLFFVFLCLQRNKSIIVCSIAFILASHIDTLNAARKLPINNFRYVANTIKNGQSASPFYKETDKLLSFIPDNDRNDIWNYNLDFDLAMLWHQELVQVNKVPLFSMYQIDKKLKNDDNVILKHPKYILFSETHNRDSSDYNFITLNYNLVAKTNPLICNIYLYKRK